MEKRWQMRAAWFVSTGHIFDAVMVLRGQATHLASKQDVAEVLAVAEGPYVYKLTLASVELGLADRALVYAEALRCLCSRGALPAPAGMCLPVRVQLAGRPARPAAAPARERARMTG